MNRLNELFCEESFAKGVSKCLARERGESYIDASISERLVIDQRIIVSEDKFANLFYKRLISNWPRPCPITPIDLKEVLFAQLSGVITEDLEAFSASHERFVEHWGNHRSCGHPGAFSASYERFVEHLLLRIPEDLDQCAHLDLGLWRKDIAAEDKDELWGPLDSAFSFYYEFGEAKGEEQTTGARGFEASLEKCIGIMRGYGTLLGYASKAAMEEAEREFRRLVPSVVRSIKLLTSRLFPDLTFGSREPKSRVIAPSCSLLTNGIGERFFSESVSSYFTPPEKKTNKKKTNKKKPDNMMQRMRNAVHLLIEADAQQNEAIALSLCFSAIESLICKKTTGITEELSRKVAALLQPKGVERQATANYVKELYDIRCKALHGEIISDAPDGKVSPTKALPEVRLLAAAVFGALVEWKNYQRRMTDTTERQKFLNELDSAERSGMLMVGAPENFFLCLRLPEQNK